MMRLALSALLSTLLLTGCGWQLRGQSVGGEDTTAQIFVDARVDQPVALHLRNSLELRGNLAELTDADVVIQLSEFETNRRITAVDQIGEASVYRITISTRVHILNGQGEELAPVRTMTQADNYNFDRRILNAMEQEERDLIDRLEQQLAEAILRRAIVVSRPQ